MDHPPDAHDRGARPRAGDGPPVHPGDPAAAPPLVAAAGHAGEHRVLGRTVEPRRPRGAPLGPLAAVVGLATGVGAVVVAAWALAGPVGGPDGGASHATDVDPTVAATGVVLDRWWARELDALDLTWEPVGPRLTDGDGTVVCDGAPIVLDEILTENAYATWCPEGPAIAFDPARFAPTAVTTQVVLAHEWGHLVQFHNPDVDLPTIDPTSSPAERELQADCFAGAWAADHVVGEFHGLMLANIGGFGDPSWVPRDDEHGHGTARERTAAYEAGAGGGVGACLPPTFDPR